MCNDNVTVIIEETELFTTIVIDDNCEQVTIIAEALGAQGLSAYDIAVANGFEGTEEEWLESLKSITNLVTSGFGENIDVDLTGVALESTSQAIKTKVDTLSNYDDATAQSKLDAIKTKTDTLVNTDLTGIATTQNVTDAQIAIEDKIDAIPATDLTGVETDLNIINEGVQKASLFIPHTTDL